MGTIKERMKQNNIATDHAIVKVIADRMKQLYGLALSKFTQNIRFWDEYIKFLQSFKYTKDISSAFDRMLKVCSFAFLLWEKLLTDLHLTLVSQRQSGGLDTCHFMGIQ